MDQLLTQIDGYCERIDASYWSEPVNAVTNLAFIISAVIMWRLSRAEPYAKALCIILFCIGVGSYLFHTHAQVWAAIADVVPIVLFILVYVQAVNQHVWLLRPWPALGVTLLFFPFAYVTMPLWEAVPLLNISAAYLPVPALILIYAFLLRNRAPLTARGLVTGAAILLVSLTFRSLDEVVCDGFKLGTHFMWHILNALMLGWMIAVYLRHRRTYAST